MIYSDSLISRMIRRSFDLRPRPWSDPDTQQIQPRNTRTDAKQGMASGFRVFSVFRGSLPLDVLLLFALVFFLCLGFWATLNAFSGPGRTGQSADAPTPTGQSPAEGGRP
jgi:hypothetical protein